MNVLLVDIDSKIPNLALMKISMYHKLLKDNVGFNINNPDKIYVSCIFNKNKEQAYGLKHFYPNSEIIFGGSALNYNTLPWEIESLIPDYDLYPSTYSQGYTTRGCTKQCPYCIVNKKEGKLKRNQHIKHFHDNRFNTVMIMDNNWLADKEWFFENTDYLIENNLKLIEHGMDIHLLDEDIVQRLKKIKFSKSMKFAFDNLTDEKAVLNGIQLLKDEGIDLKHKVMIYVLTGYNTTKQEDWDRIRLLRSHGVDAFIMQYKRTKETKKIAHMVNRKEIYWSNKFYEELFA